jgi:C4-dicarboxylate-specific signal transduction histidine kinase
MKNVFPKRIAILSVSLTVFLLVGLFLGLSSTIKQLQRIERVDIPLIELTTINLKLQKTVKQMFENLVKSGDKSKIKDFLVSRQVLEEQIRDYFSLIEDESVEYDRAIKINDRSQLTNIENQIVQQLRLGQNSEAQTILNSEKFRNATDEFQSPYKDIAESLADRRDKGIVNSASQFNMLLTIGLATLIFTVFMWWRVWASYKFNLQRRKHAEDELEMERIRAIHAARMVSLGEMAGGIAHEINNPLAVILGSIQLVKMRMSDAEIDRTVINKGLERAIRTVDRITKIVRGLKSFSRNGENDPFELVELQDLVEDTVELIQGKCKSSGVEIKLFKEQYNFQFECRSVQISQVILNLLSNSIDAVKSLEEKWIKLSVEVLSQGKDQILQISIIDSGKGIEGEINQKMFTPFFTTKQPGEGTGLGLSISYGIVKSHGGQIYLDRKNINTRMVVELPVSQVRQKILQLA